MTRSYHEQLKKAAACDGKEQLTLQVAKLIIRQAKGLHAYRCQYCEHWHVGNSTGNLSRKKRRFTEKELTDASD